MHFRIRTDAKAETFKERRQGYLLQGRSFNHQYDRNAYLNSLQKTRTAAKKREQ